MTEPPKTVLLVGSGAVQDAWAPVISALRSLDYPVECPETANFLLATETNWARMQMVYLPNEEKDRETVRVEAFERIERIISRISEHLLNQPRVLRPEFRDVILRCLSDDSFEMLTVCTTNWDRAIEDALLTPLPVFHLHGEAGGPLYLPSELAAEPYRPVEHGARLTALHRGFHRSMAHCDHLILYGLSLSPLDAELALIIQTRAWSLGQVTVVNPDPCPVMRRLKVLRGGASYPVLHVDPRQPTVAPSRLALTSTAREGGSGDE